MQFAIDDTFNTVAKMKVIGVGGAGGNAVNRMVQSGFEGVEFVSINTDAMALDNNMAHVRIQIGEKITGGLGAGANPRIGMEAMEEDREKVKAHLEGCDMVFITAGMGGGTGTGAAPVVAEIAREMGILTVGVVTKPFVFEGPVRDRNCRTGLDALRKVVDTIIVIPNQKLLSIIERTTTFREAFKLADEVLTSATRGISDIILKHGDIQVDFADVKAIMSQGGDALMGSGTGIGENRAVDAADKAIHSPLLEEVSISGATGVLVNISGGEDMSMMEINDAMNFIYEAVGNDNNANIIFGTVINPNANDELTITVIATGFGQEKVTRPSFSAPGSSYKEPLSTNVNTNAGPRPIQRIERPLPPSDNDPFDFLHEKKSEESLGEPVRMEDIKETSSNGESMNHGKKEAETQKNPLLHQGALQGKYRENDPDVDYETPAFLRYPTD